MHIQGVRSCAKKKAARAGWGTFWGRALVTYGRKIGIAQLLAECIPDCEPNQGLLNPRSAVSSEPTQSVHKCLCVFHMKGNLKKKIGEIPFVWRALHLYICSKFCTEMIRWKHRCRLQARIIMFVQCRCYQI